MLENDNNHPLKNGNEIPNLLEINANQSFSLKVGLIFLLMVILILAALGALIFYTIPKINLTDINIQINTEKQTASNPETKAAASTKEIPAVPTEPIPKKKYIQINSLEEFLLPGTAVDTPKWRLIKTSKTANPSSAEDSPYPPIERMAQIFHHQDYYTTLEHFAATLSRFENQALALNNFNYHFKNNFSTVIDLKEAEKIGDNTYCRWSDSRNPNNDTHLYSIDCCFRYNNIIVYLNSTRLEKDFSLPLHYLKKYFDNFQVLELY